MAIMLGKIRGNKKEMTAERSVLLRRVLQYLRKSTGKNDFDRFHFTRGLPSISKEKAWSQMRQERNRRCKKHQCKQCKDCEADKHRETED